MEINGFKIDESCLSISEKKDCYESLRKQCLEMKLNQFQFGQGVIKTIYPLLRRYKLEIQGEENIPCDSNVLFVVNHSNSHDIFTAYEMFSLLGRTGSVMVATDCLSPITAQIFNVSNATLLDRRVKEERRNSVFQLSSKILKGVDGLIFSEGTWNIHPYMPMHNIQNGGAKVSLITQVPIIPTIMEYIENEGFVSSDAQLFSKCIIRFGKPIMVNYADALSLQSAHIKNEMIDIRKGIWSDYSIKKGSLSDVDPQIYLNHTYAKKFQAFGFTYDSRAEQKCLLFLDGEPNENEYTIDEQGNFVPGVTEKGRILAKRKK